MEPQWWSAASGLAVVLALMGVAQHLLPDPAPASPAVAPAAEGRGFAFTAVTPEGAPVRYDPCRTIHYVVNADHGPAGAESLVVEAIRRVAEVTGLRFAYDGRTHDLPPAGGAVDPGSPPPVWIGWVPDGVGLVPDGAAATGGSTRASINRGTWAYVTGQVVIEAHSSWAAVFGPGRTLGNLLLHEVGHLVGLGHVSDRAQLMYPVLSDASPDGFGAGDRAGLLRIGAGAGCL